MKTETERPNAAAKGGGRDFFRQTQFGNPITNLYGLPQIRIGRFHRHPGTNDSREAFESCRVRQLYR
jgi:hypothetical protein